MPNLEQYQSQLATNRSQTAEQNRKLLLLQEELKRNERRLREVGRKGAAGQNEQAALQQRNAQLKGEIDAARANFNNLLANSGNLLQGLAKLADPTRLVESIPTAYPFLLFPVRVETRFKVKANEDVDQDQLWLRFYPDECQVNAFEEILSETEVNTTKDFWAEFWAAGGFEDQQRSAWRAFVASNGSGRAAWIISQLRPSNESAEPTKANADDILLIVHSSLVLTAPQESAALTYWEEFWLADEDKNAKQAAYATLTGVVGSSLAKQVTEEFVPVNLLDEPSGKERNEVAVTALRILFPPDSDIPTKAEAWTQAPRAALLPDRFVVTLSSGSTSRQVMGNPIPDGLTVGPDPSLPQSEQMTALGGDLQVNEALKWMVDFDRAIQVGMGMKIDLSAAEAANGFDRLTVIGLRLSSNAAQSQAELEALLQDHYHSRHGFSFIPQGSPTNNTEGMDSGYTWKDDADGAFDLVFLDQSAFPTNPTTLERKDGQWFAAYLGLDEDKLKSIPHAGGTDQAETRAMNRALWPATMGYFMEEMMESAFTPEDRRLVQVFFTEIVSARGPVPAVRVGNQPYGILPVTPFAQMQFPDGRGVVGDTHVNLTVSNLDKIHAFLMKMEPFWEQMATKVPHVGQPGDPHQTLLDTVGLNHGTVEYHQRYSQTLTQHYNALLLQGSPAMAQMWLDTARAFIQAFAAQLGFSPDKMDMKILEMFHRTDQDKLIGDVVDDQELSETDPVRVYTADNRNYLQWLAESSLDTIRKQDFGSGQPAPRSLLYLMLRHAMMLSHWDTGLKLLEKAQPERTFVRKEVDFIQVQTPANAPAYSGSKFEPLYGSAAQINASLPPSLTVADYIIRPEVMASLEAAGLRSLREAVSFLEAVPTARLERLFAEHVDTVSYRLDAWKTGLRSMRVMQNRAKFVDDQRAEKGLQVGSFAFLENVRPENKPLTPFQLPPALENEFGGSKGLVKDARNGGYIHAPSLDHATAAAILKNAYEANADSANPDAFAVNLSSERVRNALSVLEGIRNGQTMAALLGYRFERGLHDAHNLAEVDKFIYPLRKAFPLVADRLSRTRTLKATRIQLVEARNVIDGVKLAEHVRDGGSPSYPFGLDTGTDPGDLPVANANEKAAIDREVNKLLDVYDAIADLVMAENVYQVVRGNFEKAAAISEAFSQGKYPHEPEVVNTPRNGIGLTHRLALHLDPAALAAPGSGPRAVAEAPLNQWIEGLLPPPSDTVTEIAYTAPALAEEKIKLVSLADLGLQGIDLLFLFNLEQDQAMAELDDRIYQFVRYNNAAGWDPHPGMRITIRYTQPVPGKVTFFELTAAIRSLRKLVLRSRALKGSDIALPQEAEGSSFSLDIAGLNSRITATRNALNTLLINNLDPLRTDASGLDDYAQAASDLFQEIARYGVPGTGTSNLHDGIRIIWESIRLEIEKLTERWDGRAAEFGVLMAGYAALTTDEERFELLRTAEGKILSTTTAEPPATPALYKSAVEASKVTFDADLAAFKALLTSSAGKLTDYVAQVQAIEASAALHDAIPFSIEAATGDGSPEKPGSMALHRDTIVAQVISLYDDLSKRIAACDALLTEAAAATSEGTALQLLSNAAKQVLGEEFKLLPRFSMDGDQATEVANAAAATNDLTQYLRTTQNRLFPVDDWLYGLARVREKCGHLENLVMLSEAFGQSGPELTPLQFPFRSGDHWLALEFPDDYEHLSEHLLYTAILPAGFNTSQPQCGLLLDEWNEVIPSKQETTGITFHYDQPNSEPAQAWLLVTPAGLGPTWSWNDLLNGVNSALDEAKKRAVEPDQIDKTVLGQYLPATMMAVTLYQMTIMTNLLHNNNFYSNLNP